MSVCFSRGGTVQVAVHTVGVGPIHNVSRPAYRHCRALCAYVWNNWCSNVQSHSLVLCPGCRLFCFGRALGFLVDWQNQYKGTIDWLTIRRWSPDDNLLQQKHGWHCWTCSWRTMSSMMMLIFLQWRKSWTVTQDRTSNACACRYNVYLLWLVQALKLM